MPLKKKQFWYYFDWIKIIPAFPSSAGVENKFSTTVKTINKSAKDNLSIKKEKLILAFSMALSVFYR